MNGWDQRYAKVKEGYDMAVKALDLGYDYPSGFIAFFKLLGYFTPLNVKEAKAMVEEGVARGQESFDLSFLFFFQNQIVALKKAVDQDVMAFMYALGVGYEANQARANLYWSFAALGGSVLGNMALGYRYAKGLTVPYNCEKALEHYSLVARVVMDDLSYSGGGLK